MYWQQLRQRVRERRPQALDFSSCRFTVIRGCCLYISPRFEAGGRRALGRSCSRARPPDALTASSSRAAPGRASAMRSQRAGAGAAPGRARPPRSDVLATTSTESAQATRKPSIARRAGSLAFEVVACTSRRESRRDRPRLTSPRNVRVSARYGCRSCRSRSSASTFVDQGRADAHQLSRRGRSSFRCRISPTRSPYAVGSRATSRRSASRTSGRTRALASARSPPSSRRSSAFPAARSAPLAPSPSPGTPSRSVSGSPCSGRCPSSPGRPPPRS